MDLTTDGIILEEPITFETLDLCQMKYLPSLEKLTLHPFDSEIIYEVIDFSAPILNTTNNTNSTNDAINHTDTIQ